MTDSFGPVRIVPGKAKLVGPLAPGHNQYTYGSNLKGVQDSYIKFIDSYGNRNGYPKLYSDQYGPRPFMAH